MKKLLLLTLFLVSYLAVGQEIPKDCKKYISYEFDKFENTHSYRTKSTLNGNAFKIINNERETFVYLMLRTTGITITSPDYFYIEFTDGEIIKRDCEVKRSYSGGSRYNYSVYYKVPQDELELFKSKTIKDYKIGIYEDRYKEGDKFREYFICLLESN